MKTVSRARFEKERDAEAEAEVTRERDLPVASKGRDVEHARVLLDEYCDARREAIIKWVLARIRNAGGGHPFSSEEAMQGWLEVAAIEGLRSALSKEIRAGKRASKRLNTD